MLFIMTSTSLADFLKNLWKKMSQTPNFDELKVECNSNRLEHCYRYMFMQEEDENESFIALMYEECEVVRRRMQRRRELLDEGQTFSPFCRVSGNGLQGMTESQYTDGLILAALTRVLELACGARDEKRRHVATMERYG